MVFLIKVFHTNISLSGRYWCTLSHPSWNSPRCTTRFCQILLAWCHVPDRQKSETSSNNSSFIIGHDRSRDFPYCQQKSSAVVRFFGRSRLSRSGPSRTFCSLRLVTPALLRSLACIMCTYSISLAARYRWHRWLLGKFISSRLIFKWMQINRINCSEQLTGFWILPPSWRHDGLTNLSFTFFYIFQTTSVYLGLQYCSLQRLSSPIMLWFGTSVFTAIVKLRRGISGMGSRIWID